MALPSDYCVFVRCLCNTLCLMLGWMVLFESSLQKGCLECSSTWGYSGWWQCYLVPEYSLLAYFDSLLAEWLASKLVVALFIFARVVYKTRVSLLFLVPYSLVNQNEYVFYTLPYFPKTVKGILLYYVNFCYFILCIVKSKT